MNKPPSPSDSPTVFGADEQHDVPVDVARWVRLAHLVLDEERVTERLGPDTEMSLLFVDAPTNAESQAQIRRPGRPARRRTGDRGPAVGAAYESQAQIRRPGRPARRRTGVRGPAVGAAYG